MHSRDLRQYVVMADRWRPHGGWAVQIVHLEGAPDHRDGTWIRVTQYGSWVADVRSVAELKRYFPLASMETLGLASHADAASLMRRSTECLAALVSRAASAAQSKSSNTA
jgi:hypothetical protein